MSQKGRSDGGTRGSIPAEPAVGGSGTDPATRTEGEGETLDMPEGFQSFTSGQVLGERYQILEILGRGGMGEVWHAFDLKLRVEVALKALRGDLFKSERRLELLRQEVRAAREVVSPNVCRIFDLIEVEDRELVSMEYVDGATLLGVLQERGPLELKEAQDIASQFLAGLEAIHKVGLIHRDIKPENIMLTRAGRVVVMDFGLARQETEGGGTVSGTPAYMAPEQAAGQTVDARADVYAAGVVLAEMVSPEGIKSFESRQSVWEGVRSEPAKLPDSPWAPAIKKAVAKDREGRYNSAHTLTRALEDVTLRVEGAEDLHPYPGLASFTEADAEYFFGREADVERLWRRLDRPHLLGIVGPSGSGKTSFIRAGLIPSAGTGWAIATCTPGNAALASLRRALASEVADDSLAVGELAVGDADSTVSAFSRWRARHGQAVLIVDQFEELFTLNPTADQADFAELLERLALEADVYVLLSMRDDFLMECRDHEPLEPIFSDLTALPTLSGSALRRAVVQPATKCGYRFADDVLVEEMLAEVEGERGALPLLAFAAARLWEKRDRETGLLTRQAYHDIGGVGGSLARHAEATIDRIGTDHIAIVRELFRNLVTAEGTRAVREWGELLSIFSESQRESAEEVLRELIDARLLTSYEIHEDEREPTRHVEIIHESLLANWPRLVRWQTQDADAVQLRDQLRQAARTWGEHDHSDDLLWTGTAYREFQVWRERYPGGLSETEEAFGRAMTSISTRRRRRRRVVLIASAAILVAVLAVVTALWRQSVQQTRRAEAARLIALGQLELESHPTGALAWARASLDLADTRDGRMFALRALSKGPVAQYLPLSVEVEGVVHHGQFSPDGEWVALQGYSRVKAEHRSGGPLAFVDAFPTSGFRTVWPVFDASSRRLGVWYEGETRTYSVPEYAEVARVEREATDVEWLGGATATGFYEVAPTGDKLEIGLRPFEGDPTIIGHIEPCKNFYFDPGGSWFVCNRGADIYLHSLKDPGAGPRRLARLDGKIGRIRAHPLLEWIAVEKKGTDTIIVLPLGRNTREPLRTFNTRGLKFHDTGQQFMIEPQGNRIAIGGSLEGKGVAFIWDLRSPIGADPLVIRSGASSSNGVTFDPRGRWLTTGQVSALGFWPLPSEPTLVFPGDSEPKQSVAFTPDAGALVTSGWGGVHLQPLTGDNEERQRLYEPAGFSQVRMDPQGRFAIISDTFSASAVVLPLDGSDPTRFQGFSKETMVSALAYDPDRGLVAAAPHRGPRNQKVIRVWNLHGESVQVLGPTDDAGDDFVGAYFFLEFLPDGSMLSSGHGGIRRWNLEDRSFEVVFEGDTRFMGISPDGGTVATIAEPDRSLVIIDLESGTVRQHPFQGSFVTCAFSPDGDIVAAGMTNGVIQIGQLSGRKPHLLIGHDADFSYVTEFAFSPDGRRLASADSGGTLRVWPVPDVSKPPLHTLPHAELLAKLDTITNLRVVRDEESPTGWKVEVGPFPGWGEVPTW